MINGIYGIYGYKSEIFSRRLIPFAAVVVIPGPALVILAVVAALAAMAAVISVVALVVELMLPIT